MRGLHWTHKTLERVNGGGAFLYLHGLVEFGDHIEAAVRERLAG
jgi:hypothetical protein